MSTVNERWLDCHGKDHDEPKAKTPPKSRPPMSRKKAEVEALGIIDAAGKLVVIFPVGLEHRYLAPHPGDRKVKFVPFDPDAARVLRS